jgi:hypothetical protein
MQSELSGTGQAMLREYTQGRLKGICVVRRKNHVRLHIEALEERLTPSAIPTPATYQVEPEAPVLSRLARFVPNPVPAVSNWVTVSAADPHLDPATNGGDTNIYVIAHGWAPGFQDMVMANGTATDPLKWWQTLDTSLTDSPGTPASAEMFYGTSASGTQISPSGLAYAITQADPKAVVLAYSWIDDSATDNFLGIPHDAYLSEAHTELNGKRLTNALEMALPTTFHADGGGLHLIGHSHGSKVATLATLALEQTANPNFQVAHLTILDSPEVSSELVSLGDAANNLWYFLGGLNISHTSPSATQTFVDNYISEFDNPIGPIQGVNPFNTGQTEPALQQVVDVSLNGGVLYGSLDFGGLHGYSFSWYAGGSMPWTQNPTPNVADQWSPLVNPANVPHGGSYTQTWTSATQNQFQLTAGPANNTVTDTPTFNDVSFFNTSVTPGSSFNPANGQVTLTENGSGTADFIGEFSPESSLDGVSLQYQFSNVGQGDQLVIWVDTGILFSYRLYFVMTGTVAGTSSGVGTLSLTSLDGAFFNHDIQMQLIPAAGSSGASVTISNVQQFSTQQSAGQTANPIRTLANSRNFYVDSGGLYENAGAGAKWLRGNVNSFGNTWYYITTTGDLYEWNGLAGLGGNLLASLGTNAWENPELVCNASTLTAANPAQVVSADQVRAFFRSSTGNFYQNALGGQEKWIEGLISAKVPADRSNPWYYILPDGSVHEWDGKPSLTGPVVTSITPDTNLYKDPRLLDDAFQDTTVNSAGFDQQLDFHFDRSAGSVRNLWENFLGADEKWFRGVTNSYGNTWYILLPNGDLREANGTASGKLLANLGPNAWNDIERVVTDFEPALSPTQTATLQSLDKTYSLLRASGDGNFYFNLFGAQEKWLFGAVNAFGNRWYFLLPNNSLIAWNGTAAATGAVLATNLPSQVYQDPLVLADAYADGSVLDSAIQLDPFGRNSGGPGDRLG